MRRSLLAVVATTAALVAGCGGDSGDGAGSATQPAAPVTTTAATPESSRPVVDMNDRLEFAPKTITVKAGEKVQWRNIGKIAHTVTTTPSKVADPKNVEIPEGAKDFDSRFIGEGEDYERTFTEPGTYRYVCIPHEGAGMVGAVVVER